MGMKVRSSGFDSYDPDINSYDPSIARKINNADGGSAGSPNVISSSKPGQKMQINLTITNGTAAVMTAEMFQWLDSCTFRYKSELAVGNYLMIPESSHEGLRRVVANSGGVVGWDQNGNLCYRGNDATPDPLLTIGCSEVAYRSLFQASSILPFNISFIRENVTTSGQIDNKITWFRKTIGGGYIQNVVSPRAYFRPNQYQNLTIDIDVSLTIQVDSGIQMPVKAGETVTLALFINFWTYQDIGG